MTLELAVVRREYRLDSVEAPGKPPSTAEICELAPTLTGAGSSATLNSWGYSFKWIKYRPVTSMIRVRSPVASLFSDITLGFCPTNNGPIVCRDPDQVLPKTPGVQPGRRGWERHRVRQTMGEVLKGLCRGFNPLRYSTLGSTGSPAKQSPAPIPSARGWEGSQSRHERAPSPHPTGRVILDGASFGRVAER